MSNDRKRGTPDAAGSKIRTDERGRSVWAEPVAAADLELVTTQELRGILKSTDEQSVRAIEDVAKAGDDEGVLVRNAETGMFQIIGDTELRAILDRENAAAAAKAGSEATLEPLDPSAGDDGEFSLVSTQALRQMIREENQDADGEPPPAGGGFDPYNSG